MKRSDQIKRAAPAKSDPHASQNVNPDCTTSHADLERQLAVAIAQVERLELLLHPGSVQYDLSMDGDPTLANGNSGCCLSDAEEGQAIFVLLKWMREQKAESARVRAINAGHDDALAEAIVTIERTAPLRNPSLHDLDFASGAHLSVGGLPQSFSSQLHDPLAAAYLAIRCAKKLKAAPAAPAPVLPWRARGDYDK